MDPIFSRMDYTWVADVANALVGLGIVALVYLILRADLRRLLSYVIEIPAGADFYLRAFALVLLATGLGKVLLGAGAKVGAAPMDLVWAVALRVGTLLDSLIIVLLIFVGMITVLAAVAGTRHGK